jgi:TctA family transporter
VENHFRRGMILAEGKFSAILDHPIAVTFLVIAALFLCWPVVKGVFKRKKGAIHG